MDFTENEFKEMKKEHITVWHNLEYLPTHEREKLLREMYPAMYNEKDKLKDKWYD